jgi:hypothetical protein
MKKKPPSTDGGTPASRDPVFGYPAHAVCGATGARAASWSLGSTVSMLLAANFALTHFSVAVT